MEFTLFDFLLGIVRIFWICTIATIIVCGGLTLIATAIIIFVSFLLEKIFKKDKNNEKQNDKD